MRYEIRSISLWPFIKISFFANLILGFLLGLLYAMLFGFIVTVLSKLPGFQAPGLDKSDIPFGVLIILMPILFAILGAFFNTIIGAVFIFVYNMLARMLGGLEFEMAPAPTAAPGAPPSGYNTTVTMTSYTQTPPPSNSDAQS